VVKDIRAGDVVTTDNIRSIRPGLGLPPSRLWNVLGKTASRDIARGEPLAMDMIEPA
jgi:N-acetylneuraminate synthase